MFLTFIFILVLEVVLWLELFNDVVVAGISTVCRVGANAGWCDSTLLLLLSLLFVALERCDCMGWGSKHIHSSLKLCVVILEPIHGGRSSFSCPCPLTMVSDVHLSLNLPTEDGTTSCVDALLLLVLLFWLHL